MTAVEAVTEDLALLEKRQSGISRTAEAATALAMARELDSDSSATSKSMCARALTETMEKLRAMCPPAVEADGVDDLLERRRARRSG